ncbi:putative LysM domain domain-containing protein [Neospora caninum Liverpool]|uniref:LysM domain domain-containing protein, putative n=1 Tax=Neospora caninum (strain Liverpool) TaxID=572307 RepID=F0VP61_NEOCL|nr:putative LysM domain domain-containing protein [Neospora caninum Liverpool]CBZ55507.1 putative LysM domain domain-containing protein [Neospora caninum Liverpool]CEL70245.1 TPA: LysM domain domain-containing protein, putative [Neospora caninum Liverpool]|eukprot:XP_003885535.1 putative LysM domain domain-containing protein [Neospora caninum Liverpool]
MTLRRVLPARRAADSPLSRRADEGTGPGAFGRLSESRFSRENSAPLAPSASSSFSAQASFEEKPWRKETKQRDGLEYHRVDSSAEEEKAEEHSCTHIHRIQAADTLLSIALQYDVPVSHIMVANHLSSTDIWYKNELLIPCNGRCQKQGTHALSSPSGCSPALSGAEDALDRDGCGRNASPFQHGERRDEVGRGRAGDACARTGELPNKASGGSQRNSHAGRGDGDSSPRACMRMEVPEAVQKSAHTAMMVEAIVRQAGVDPKLARAQLAFRNGDADLARADCCLLKRWQDELDVTPPEILAYLSVTDGDVVRAREAMMEDAEWHRELEAHRATTRARNPGFSVSSLIHARSLFSPSSARYISLVDEDSLAPVSEDRAGGHSGDSAHLPRIIGRISSSLSTASTALSGPALDEESSLFSTQSPRPRTGRRGPPGLPSRLRFRPGETRREPIGVEMREF